MNATERKQLKISARYYIYRAKDGYYFRGESQGITRRKKEACKFSRLHASRLLINEPNPGWQMVKVK